MLDTPEEVQEAPRSYEIDLNKKYSAAFEKVMKPFLDAARSAPALSRTSRRRAAPRGAGGTTAAMTSQRSVSAMLIKPCYPHTAFRLSLSVNSPNGVSRRSQRRHR